MPTAVKAQKIDSIKSLFSDHEHVILTEYRGLTVADISNLRRDLATQSTQYKVLKNTLVKRAVDELGIEGLDQYLEGPTAIAFVGGDISAAAKAISGFAKGRDSLVIKGGVLAGKIIDGAQVGALASLPSREVLIGQFLGVLNAPIGSLARVIAAPTQNLVNVLDQIAKQKESAA